MGFFSAVKKLFAGDAAPGEAQASDGREPSAAPEAASVLILKDSFQNATIDYLSAIFRSVTVVDPRSYQETPDLASLLDADGIDLVLFFYHQNNVSRELIDFLSA